VLAEQLAEAIKHVHRKGLINGDLKLQDVVRFGEGLRLIALDASVEIDSTLMLTSIALSLVPSSR